MSTRTLKWISVVLPVLFMVAVIFLRVNFVPSERSLEGNLFAVLAVALGAIGFSILFFNFIEHRENEISLRSHQLEALHQAALALTTELDLQVVLQKVVDISRELLHAKYGALGVLEPGSTHIVQFITSGVSQEDRARIGPPPTGHGLLGVLISPTGSGLIVNDIRSDPRSVGFPPNHPPMKSLLGVPIKSKGEIFGNLYIADKFEDQLGEDKVLLNFDPDDFQLLQKFATQAAIAIENAQLYRKTQELAVVQERERFGMALHDGIMQSVYAIGLSLSEAKRRVLPTATDLAGELERSIQDLGQVQRDLRNYIMGLRTGRFQGQDLSTSISQLATELRANTLMTVTYDQPPRATTLGVDESIAEELLLITQEALNNIRKHALARNVRLAIKRLDGHVSLTIADDGIGFDLIAVLGGEGNGLRNMQERARKLGGSMEIESRPGQGTVLTLQIPVKLAVEN